MKLLRDREYLRRAYAAWFRTSAKQPAETSHVETHGGKLYVVLLKNGNSILAIYRVTNQDRLKKLRRWPKEVAA